MDGTWHHPCAFLPSVLPCALRSGRAACRMADIESTRSFGYRVDSRLCQTRYAVPALGWHGHLLVARSPVGACLSVGLASIGPLTIKGIQRAAIRTNLPGCLRCWQDTRLALTQIRIHGVALHLRPSMACTDHGTEAKAILLCLRGRMGSAVICEHLVKPDAS